MNLLLDTNILLFALSSPDRISKEFISAIESPKNHVFVSSVTIWEIVTKVQIGKLQVLVDFSQGIEQLGVTMLDFNEKDAFEILNLPLHHRDPFDRGLLAQARRNQFRFMTSDARLKEYGALVNVQIMNES
ncbi:MAG: type II toxin-antitoxin system VapC family toxin [Armatimonadota bacterium]